MVVSAILTRLLRGPFRCCSEGVPSSNANFIICWREKREFINYESKVQLALWPSLNNAIMKLNPLRESKT